MEEKQLVLEEMRRTLKSLEWKKEWWKRLPTLQNKNGEVLDGHFAYVQKQISVLECLSQAFQRRWEVIMNKNGMQPPWLE